MFRTNVSARTAASFAAAAVVAALLTTVGPAQAAEFHPSSNNSTAFSAGATTTDSLVVNGAGGYVTAVTVTLHDLSVDAGAAITATLTSPDGTTRDLLSSACAGTSGATFTLSDGSPQAPKGATCAEGGPYAPVANLSAFEGENPDGRWTLSLTNPKPAGGGVVAGGFELGVQTSQEQGLIPGADTSGPANPYPISLGANGKVGTITDVNLELRGVTHRSVGDIDALLVSPAGTAVWVTSDACGSVDVHEVTWTFDDEAAGQLPAPGTGTVQSCGTGSFRPSAYTDADSDDLPAPAPSATSANPYQTSLSAFDGQTSAGGWKLFIVDDRPEAGGYLLGAALKVTTSATSTAAAPAPAQSVSTTVVNVPTVSVTAPNTRFTKRKYRGHKQTAVLAFASTKSPSTFQCKLDHKKWRACGSQIKLTKLGYGRHYFKVRAIDAAGNVDRSPARNSWRVLRPGEK